MPFASEQPDADAVLRALSGRISQLLASAGLTIEASDQISDAARAALVDTDGHVISVLPGAADVARADKATREAIWGLVESYRYVLDARHELDRALQRAEHAERDALQDHLTGLPNRRAWDRAIEREAARQERNDSKVAIAVVDIDGLKAVNDEHGHLAGDLLVRQAAEHLHRTFRGGDLVARIGGDEFAILVVDYTDDRAELLATRIRDCLSDAGVHASVGVAVHTEGHELTEVFATADAAMYTDKQSNSANRAPLRSTR